MVGVGRHPAHAVASSEPASEPSSRTHGGRISILFDISATRVVILESFSNGKFRFDPRIRTGAPKKCTSIKKTKRVTKNASQSESNGMKLCCHSRIHVHAVTVT